MHPLQPGGPRKVLLCKEYLKVWKEASYLPTPLKVSFSLHAESYRTGFLTLGSMAWLGNMVGVCVGHYLQHTGHRIGILYRGRAKSYSLKSPFLIHSSLLMTVGWMYSGLPASTLGIMSSQVDHIISRKSWAPWVSSLVLKRHCNNSWNQMKVRYRTLSWSISATVCV